MIRILVIAAMTMSIFDAKAMEATNHTITLKMKDNYAEVDSYRAIPEVIILSASGDILYHLENGIGEGDEFYEQLDQVLNHGKAVYTPLPLESRREAAIAFFDSYIEPQITSQMARHDLPPASIEKVVESTKQKIVVAREKAPYTLEDIYAMTETADGMPADRSSHPEGPTIVRFHGESCSPCDRVSALIDQLLEDSEVGVSTLMIRRN